jgi:hypothetical protein
MGRPLKKKNFGSNANNNIKVQFHNGTTSTYGYIVKQYSSRKFKCADTSGTTAVCLLVDKLSATLQAGEMSITLKADNGQVEQAVRIHQNLATVIYTGTNIVTGGTHSTGIYGQVKWSYSTSTSDTYWQIEEAGTSTTSTFVIGGVDLEGDEGFAGNGDYPVPGSGTTPYSTGTVALLGITYANIGTPFDPGSNVATVANSAAGLLRNKYDKNFTAQATTAPASWNYGFFSTATFIKSIPDTFVSWGQQTDGPGLGENRFSMEWKGYVQVPTTQNYNFYGESDDHIAMWIGTNALSAPANGTFLFAGNNNSLPDDVFTGVTVNSNSVTLTAGQWYPVRIWFSEHLGGCKAQIYAHGANGAKFSGSELTFAYNTATGGFNP